MSRIKIDPDSDIVDECFAVIYAPRRHRDRFPENCVRVVESEKIALDSQDPGNKHYAAKVIGPARSSEGFKLYYLVNWLGADQV